MQITSSHAHYSYFCDKPTKSYSQTRHKILQLLFIHIQANKKGFNLVFSSSYLKSVGSP